MLYVYSNAFVTVMDNISHIAGMIEVQAAATPKLKISAEHQKNLIPWVKKLDVLLTKIEAPAARAAARDAIVLLKTGDAAAGPIAAALDQIISRFQAELEGKDLILLTAEETRLITKADSAFGDAVSDAFPAAIEDISEASKSLALARYTAVVFHLMRAMECAVQELSTALKIPNPDREWGKLLSDMEAKIKAMPKGDAKDSWSESHAHLYHVKQAWRNKTMHPKRTYTEEEAYGVFNAARSFMRHLAPLVSS